MAFIPQIVTILTQDAYGTGEHMGTPIAWPVGASSVQVTGTLSTADLQSVSPVKTAQVTLTESFDGGLTFTRGPSAPWASNTLSSRDGSYTPPNASVSYPSSPPTHVSAIIAPNQPLSVGLQLTFS